MDGPPPRSATRGAWHPGRGGSWRRSGTRTRSEKVSVPFPAFRIGSPAKEVGDGYLEKVSVPFPAFRIGRRLVRHDSIPPSQKSQSPFRPFGLAVSSSESISYTTEKSQSPFRPFGLAEYEGAYSRAHLRESLSPLSGLSDWQSDRSVLKNDRTKESQSPFRPFGLAAKHPRKGMCWLG